MFKEEDFLINEFIEANQTCDLKNIYKEFFTPKGKFSSHLKC